MRAILLLCLLPVFSGITAQNKIRQATWQQRVDHCITVSLNDTLHRLLGDSKVTYTNNSPDTLREIWYHLWPNAYASRNTPFARQLRENGKTEFEFSKAEDEGGIEFLRFEAEGELLQFSIPNPDHPDIGKVRLPRPLLPGASIIITTPFEVKIPGRFSRFGREKDNYQITQWYPKPAVYDVNGWNPMSYLDQGEFYSEFGSFEVYITVPDNYVVAATGQLRTATEWDFIRRRIENPIDPGIPIASSTKKKTLLFMQDSIHDFAWFASKYFNIEYKSMSLNDRTVHTYGYAANKKIELVDGIQQALNFYSEQVGPYPYNYCSAVIGPLEAGGGMEYPMITVLSVDTREVVVHEVGHNWFQGILANNERVFPWMDESVNSYFDHESVRLVPFNYSASIDRPSYFDNFFNISDLIMELMAMDAEKQELHQAVGRHSEEFTAMNYGSMVYGKGAFLFRHLRRYLGDEVFVRCFHNYYDTWKFRHPLPGDMHDVFELTSGKDLDWFFVDLINSEAHVDYRIDDLKGSYLWIGSPGKLRPPFQIGLYKNSELAREIWVKPDTGELTGVQLPLDMEYDLIKIDPYRELFEVNTQNNSIRTKGLFPRVEPVALNMLFGRENPNRTQVFWMPLLSYNIYDRWMPGLYIGNVTYPLRNWSYRFLPMYSIETNGVRGTGHLSYSKFRQQQLSKTEYGVKLRSFRFERFGDPYLYTQWRPFVTWSQRGVTLRSTHWASLTLCGFFNRYRPDYDESKSLVPEWERIARLSLEAGDKQVLTPWHSKLSITAGSYRQQSLLEDSTSGIRGRDEQGDFFAAIRLEHRHSFVYDRSGHKFHVRAFGGYFLDAPEDGFYHFRVGTQAGRYDYLFEHFLPGRGAADGLWSRQLMAEGPDIYLPGNFGNISSWIAALHFSWEVPLKVPPRLYADVFSFNDIRAFRNARPIAFSAGICIPLIPKILEFRIPFINSTYLNGIMETQGYGSLGSRINFSLNLHQLNPESIRTLLH